MNKKKSVKESRTNVFISYVREDTKYLEQLHNHLAIYVRNDQINFWDDTKILPGLRWSDELSKALESARIAVFLVSAEFFASNFIARKEIPPLLDAATRGEVVIIPVVLRPCPFRLSPLRIFQTINAPSEPLCDMSVGKRNWVWVELAERINDILNPPKPTNTI